MAGGFPAGAERGAALAAGTRPAGSRAVGAVSGQRIYSEPAVLAAGGQRGERSICVCVGGQECGAALSPPLPRLRETNSPETAVQNSPVTPPCTLSRLKLSLKRPGDYLLAEANIYIPGRRLLGIYNGPRTGTRGQGQDACEQPHS